MTENTFEIILQAVDNATAEIQKVKGALGDVEKSTNDVKKTTEEAGKSIKTQFREAGKDLRDFRKTMMLVTVAIAAVIATTKEAAKYSKESKETYDEFNTSIKTLTVTVGQLLGPALEGVSFVVKVLTDTIEAAVAGFIKLSTFIAEFFTNITSGPVEAYRRAMKVSTLATDEFLNKIEETRARVSSGFTLDKEAQGVINLGKITVTASNLMKQSWEGVINAIQQLGSSLAAAEEMGRAFGYAAAAVALGLAIVNTAAGITKAFADYPWPFSMAVAGIIAAAGAIQVATIAATKFHEGGVIRAHNGLAVDEFPIIAQTGEGILSRRGMSALGGAGVLSALNSGRGGSSQYFHIEINITLNAVINNKLDIAEVAEELGFEIARQRSYSRRT